VSVVGCLLLLCGPRSILSEVGKQVGVKVSGGAFGAEKVTQAERRGGDPVNLRDSPPESLLVIPGARYRSFSDVVFPGRGNRPEKAT
jgi:hypothetical protein